jgi:hypothetical protein
MPTAVYYYIARLGYVLTDINKMYIAAAEDHGSVTNTIPTEIVLKLREEVVHNLRYIALLLVLSCSRDTYT